MSPDEEFFLQILDELDETDPSGIPHRQLYEAECSPPELAIKLAAVLLAIHAEDYANGGPPGPTPHA